ncbi:hypothetical protein [Haloglomus litoreum]|nr:hypothetical protein [Haloglomus sp. DT116]
MATFIQIDTRAAVLLTIVGAVLTAVVVAPEAVESLVSGLMAAITGAY